MEIKTITGVTQTEEIVLTKGFADLIIGFEGDFDALGDERITIFVEKKDGTQDIAKNILLKDLILLGCYGEDTIQHGTRGVNTLGTIAKVELTQDNGYIHLFENETIKIKLSDLDAGAVYTLDGIEAHEPSKGVEKYERKVVSANVVTQDYNVKGYDLMSLQKHSSIEEIDFKMDNGATVKMTPFEIETEMKSIDPFQFFRQVTFKDGAGVNQTMRVPVHQIADRLVLPLVGVDSITIRKNVGADLNLSLKIDQSDFEKYGHYKD